MINARSLSELIKLPVDEELSLLLFLLLLLWLLLWRAPRALDSGPSEHQHLLGVGREDSEKWRRTTKGVLPEAIEVGASLQPVLECLRLLLAQRARRVGCRIQ